MAILLQKINPKFKLAIILFIFIVSQFLGNFREKTKKVPTRTVSRKLPEISQKVRALLPLTQLRIGNIFDSRKFPEPYYLIIRT